jgi:hypothetical protein
LPAGKGQPSLASFTYNQRSAIGQEISHAECSCYEYFSPFS